MQQGNAAAAGVGGGLGPEQRHARPCPPHPRRRRVTPRRPPQPCRFRHCRRLRRLQVSLHYQISLSSLCLQFRSVLGLCRSPKLLILVFLCSPNSSQSRADILTLALSVTDILAGLVWLSIRPKTISPVRIMHLI